MGMGKNDGVVIGVRDNEETLLRGPQAFIKVPGFLERHQGVPITVNHKSGQKYFSGLFQSLLLDLFKVPPFTGKQGKEKRAQNGNDACEAAFQDDALNLAGMGNCKFKDGEAAQRSAHEPKPAGVSAPVKLFADGGKDRVTVLQQIHERGHPGTGAITAVIRHNQIEVLLQIKWRDIIIITGNFPIAVKVENPGASGIPGIKTAGQDHIISNRDQRIRCIGRAGIKTPAWIKNQVP